MSSYKGRSFVPLVKDKTKKNGYHLAKKADVKISHCETCNCCWEQNYLAIRNFKPKTKRWIRRDEFPTYGKAKKVCPRCQVQSS